ncbi:gag-pol fusion protein, partial [Chelydra serpentina]
PRGSTTHSGPKEPQEVHRQPEVPHGLPGHHHTLSGPRGLVCRPRYERCLFPHLYLTGPQTFPPVRRAPNTLPIYSTTFRPLHGPTCLHEMYGSGGRISSSPTRARLSVPRRLATSRPVIPTGASPRTDGHGYLFSSRYHREHLQVDTDSHSVHPIHRSDPRCNQSAGVPPRGPSSRHSGLDHHAPPVSHHYREAMPQVAGPYGVLHVRGPACQTTTSPPAGLAGFSLPTNPRRLGHGRHSPGSHAGLPAVVARPTDTYLHTLPPYRLFWITCYTSKTTVLHLVPSRFILLPFRL